MIFGFYTILGLLFFSIVGMAVVLFNFNNDVRKLFARSKPIKEKYHPDQIDALPLPVQNYFAHVLKDGQPYISYARLRHNGRFKSKPDGKWSAIHGEEYFTVEKPGFIWRGTIKGIAAVDRYVAGKGSLSVYFWHFLRIANGRGPKFSQGELLRWLGECVWFPTALLPNDHLRWEAIDDRHAKLIYHYHKSSVYYIVTFNDAHEIVQLETQRYMGAKTMETWIGKISNYKMIHHMMIPRTMRAIWKLADHEFTYAAFTLTDIEYDQPKLYQ